MALQPAGLHQVLVLARLVVLQLFHGHPAGEDHRVHGELVRAEVRIEEVHREDEAHRQQRLVTVDHGGHVDEPARDDVREQLREPEDQAGAADDEDAPEDREVVELLPVGVATVARPLTHTEEPADRPDELLQVAQVEHDRVGPENQLDPALLPALPESVNAP